MKKFLPLSVLAIIILLSSCRKEELRDVPLAPPKSSIPHCSDGVFSYDEQDLDCGGECDPCPGSLAAVCSPGQNTLSFNSAGMSGSADIVSCYELIDGGYQINSQTSSGEIDIYLGAEPTMDRVYYLQSNSFDLEYGDANVSIPTFTGYYKSTSGKLYASVDNGIITVTFCDIVFSHTSSSSITVTGSGSITCP